MVTEVKWKHASGVGSQESCTLPQNMVYSALLTLLPLMRTPRLPVVDWTDPLPPANLNGLSVSLKDQIWFLRMCHHVSNVLYLMVTCRTVPLVTWEAVRGMGDGHSVESYYDTHWLAGLWSVNWRNLRFLLKIPSFTVWRHSCVTLCCWWLPS